MQQRWIVRVLWAGVVILPVSTLLLWWLGSLPDEHAPEVGRLVFGNVPEALKALFYAATAVFLGLAAYLFALRARNWARGADERRTGLWWRRIVKWSGRCRCARSWRTASPA